VLRSDGAVLDSRSLLDEIERGFEVVEREFVHLGRRALDTTVSIKLIIRHHNLYFSVAARVDDFEFSYHDGEAEIAGFVLSGKARIYYGEDFKEYMDFEEGDFVFVPPYFPHIEGHRSDEEPLEWVTARTPDNIVVNLD
jgi:mannose-6-phosphate isomerase-like protein (cupin superfamily)